MDRIYKKRQDVNYQTEISEAVEEEAEEFMENRVEPFIKNMEEIIKDLE